MLNVRTVEPKCLVPMPTGDPGYMSGGAFAARRGADLMLTWTLYGEQGLVRRDATRERPASTRQPLSLLPSQFALYELCAVTAATSTSVAATTVTPQSLSHRPAAAPGRRGGWLGPVSSQSEPHASSSEQVPYVNESDSSLWASSGLEAQRSRSTSRCARSQSK